MIVVLTGGEWRTHLIAMKVGSRGLEEKRTAAAQKHQPVSATTLDFRQLIYDATTEFMQKQVDQAIAKSRRRSAGIEEDERVC